MKFLSTSLQTLAVIALLGGGVSAHAEEAGVNTSAEVKVTAPKPGEYLRDRKDIPKPEMRNPKAEIKADFELKKQERASSTDARKEKIASSSVARKEDRRVKTEEVVKKHAAQMTERMNAAVERLEKIATRIDSRIVKLKAEGKVTTDAEKAVAEARVTIGTIKTDIGTIPSTLSGILAQTELKGSFKPLETLAKKIHEGVKSAHKSLETAVRSLKAVSPEIKTEVKTETDTTN